MSNLLVGHELDQVHISVAEARLLELLLAELRQSVVEEVEFDQLLVQTEVKRLEVEVGFRLVGRRGVETDSTLRTIYDAGGGGGLG